MSRDRHIISLAYRPPLRWEELMAFFRKRAVRGVEEVAEVSYRRSISIGGTTGTLEAWPSRDGRHRMFVALRGIPAAMRDSAVSRIRRMFGLDADPRAICAHLGRDPRLQPVVNAFRGMRIPLTWDPFEAVVRAVLGQQISVAGAITMVGRIAQRYGKPVEGEGAITRAFPAPSDLANADLSTFGIPASRARTLSAVSRAILDGSLRLDGSVPADKLEKDFQLIRGIGPWSAQYVALRGMGEPDAFPESDLVIRKSLDALGYPADKASRKAAIDLLAPWRGYAAIYLWKALSGGG